MKRYIGRLIFRLSVFCVILYLYLTDKQQIWHVMTELKWHGVSPIGVLWAVFMVIMIQHLFPNKLRSMALRKEQKETYRPVAGYS